VSYYRKPFEFLSLGIMAYVGNDKALTQVSNSFPNLRCTMHGAE
jgi:NADH:ubiquinone reductase (non-electrogenic)